MRILIAEDDAPLALFLVKNFAAEDHVTDIAGNGEEALQRVNEGGYDLLVLDLNLPVIGGHQVLKKIRSHNIDLPILILTATDHVSERVACLDAGADDYLTKPFSFSELSARVRALLRRKGPPAQAVLKIEDLQMDCMRRTVHRAGKPIELTPKEFSLLEYFMRNAGRCITRNMIIEFVWKLSPDTMTNVVDVYVNYLRKKIDDGAKLKLIHTVRGVGYEFGATRMLQSSAKGA